MSLFVTSCSCEENVFKEAFFSSVHSPKKCPNCSLNIYSDSSFLAGVASIVGVAWLFLGLLVLKEYGVLAALGSTLLVVFTMLFVRALELQAKGVRVATNEQLAIHSGTEKRKSIIGLIIVGIVLVLTYVFE